MFDKNIILFVGYSKEAEARETIASLRSYAKVNELNLRMAVIYDVKSTKLNDKDIFNELGFDIEIPCNLNDQMQIEGALMPYKDELLAITARSPESNVTWLSKIIPHVPYIKTPTAESLTWAVDKIRMREQMSLYDKTIVPQFTVVDKVTKKVLSDLKEKIGYPMVVKPAGLALSLLVDLCYHEEDLEKALKKSFQKIKKIYKENGRTVEPKILVEHFMEGDMYSIDAYVDDVGRVAFCPPVHVETGRSIGFDDFFGYKMVTPTTLTEKSIRDAEEVSEKAIHALGLKNTTTHVELIKADDGWRVIEVGPRIGGFRHAMYKLSFGIDHQLNDVLLRMGRKISIPKKVKGYSVAMKFFAKSEGVIKEVKGVKSIQELKSFNSIFQRLKVGDKAMFAKNGGKAVFEIVLFNENRADLLADIRRVEKTVDIKIQGK